MKNKWVKIAVICSLMLSNACLLNAQTLFNYGTHAVTINQFKSAYLKNPDTSISISKSVEAYYQLYTHFVLKVQDAYDIGIDSQPVQKAELAAYRNQLANSHLNDMANADSVVALYLKHSTQDIQLQYLYIDNAAVMAPSSALARVNQAYAAIIGGMAFNKAVNNYATDDGLKKSGGQAGWISVFALPSVYEDVVYGLKDGAISKPVASSTGYYIFKRVASRKALGRRTVSQIHIANLQSQLAPELEANKRLIDSLSTLLKNGANFANLASQFSMDRSSAYKGGILPEIKVGDFDPDFEQKVFSLKQVNEVSAPFKTEFGWHIVKLYAIKTPSEETKKLEWEALIKNEVTANNLINDVKSKNILKVKKLVAFKDNNTSPDSLWYFSKAKLANIDAPVKYSNPIFYIDGKPYQAPEFVTYLRNTNTPINVTNDVLASRLLLFQNNEATQYFLSNLEKFDADFALKIKEFKEANMLFQVMDQKVWSVSQQNPSASINYYQQNKDKYKWKPNASVLLVSSTDDKATATMRQMLTTKPHTWSTVAEQFGGIIFADSARMEFDQLPGFETLLASQISSGYLSPVVANSFSNTSLFYYVFSPMPNGGLKELEDCRAQVYNDYQNSLEASWINTLKKKYPIKLNKASWNKMMLDLSKTK